MSEAEWNIKKPLEASSIKTRVVLARMATYGVFSEENSKDDFNLENLVNVFIALVQYPVSFIVLDRMKVSFHFCHDKEHYDWFTEFAEKQVWSDANSFALFPDVLGAQFRIAIVYMHTKTASAQDKVTLIERRSNCTQAHSLLEYIEACAEGYFGETWYGHRTMFNSQAKEALQTSLKKLANTYLKGEPRAWPNKAQDIFDFQTDNQIDYPSDSLDRWPVAINRELNRVINNSRYGFRVFTGLGHVKSGESIVDGPQDGPWKNVQPPNVMVAYRSYSRRLRSDDEVKARHLTQRDGNSIPGGYAHDVHFAMPEESIDEAGRKQQIDPYSAYFDFLKKRFSQNWETSYEQKDTGRVLYQNLFVAGQENQLVKKGGRVPLGAIAKDADFVFWNTLASRGGVKKIATILGSKVGDHARSMADPVFSTGLIHINPAYELGGLDRILPEKFQGYTSFEDLDQDVRDDVLRIVAVYYFFAGSAAWSGLMPRASDPRKLCVMMLPIKMRGSVWGVSAHAFYLEDYELSFQNNTTWMSNFLLATTGRRKIQGLVDGVLWGMVQRRTMRLISRYIGRARGSRELAEAIPIINQKMKGEQLLSPYALPKFTLQVWEDDSAGERNGRWFVGQRIPDPRSKRDKFIRLSWTIEENDFFTARQPWSKRGTRNFLNVVDLGLKRGVEQLLSNSR